MDREDIKDKLVETTGNDAYNRGIKKANRVAKIWINKIFDHFESRTCEHCKYLDLNKQCWKNKILHQAQGFYGLNFGCNKWEAKKRIEDTVVEKG